jgi:hypothetical protein
MQKLRKILQRNPNYLFSNALYYGPCHSPLPSPLAKTTSPEQKEHKFFTMMYVLAIQPLLSAIYASNSKAHRSAMTARTLVQRNESWVGRLGGMFWEGKERFDGDLIGGLMEMRGLVPMLMEQRRGKQVNRKNGGAKSAG